MPDKKVLPHSVDAEQCVIGSLLLDREVIADVLEVLTPEDFYDDRCKEFFMAVTSLFNDHIPVDIITVADYLQMRDKLEPLGGYQHIMDMCSRVPTTANVKYYAKTVKELSMRRKIYRLGVETAKYSFEGSKELSSIIMETVKSMQEIDTDNERENIFMPDNIDSVIKAIERRGTSMELAGIPSGFSDLDSFTGGLQECMYIMLGARPKMGKTSLFTQISETVSRNHPVEIFSLEMYREQLIKVLLYQIANVDSQLEQLGKLTEAHLQSIREAARILKARKLFIDDKSRTIQEIKASHRKTTKICYQKGFGPVKLAVVDYVQQIRGDRRLSRNYQLEEVSRDLCEMKKNEKLCIMALGQLSRDIEDRQNKRPLPSDMKDSGTWEQDCDVLMLMYRDAQYNGRNNKNHTIHEFRGGFVPGDLVEVNCFLNRFGPAGVMEFEFIAPFRKFIRKHGQITDILDSEYDDQFTLF
jgi:replicative DNA helicase